MESGWSTWAENSNGQRVRFCIINGETLLQYGGSEGPIQDSYGNHISPQTRQQVLMQQENLPIVPRWTPTEQLLGQRSGNGGSIDFSDFELTSRAGPGSTDPRSRLPQVNEGEGEDSDPVTFGPELTTVVTVDQSALTGQPSRGLASARTVAGPLPPGYTIQPAHFFVPGRVFRVLWIEPEGNNARSMMGNVDEYAVFKTLRPVVVVSRRQHGECVCLPIFSYGGRGVSKPGLTEREVRNHAIIHLKDEDPTLVPGEHRWEQVLRTEDAFAVDPVRGVRLSSASRIRFNTPYTVRFNVKVMNIGRVVKEDHERLQERCQQSIFGSR